MSENNESSIDQINFGFFKKRNVMKRFGQTLPAGSTVFRAGDQGDEMFIIDEGQIKISLQTQNAEQVLAIVGPGDFFGEMSVFTNQARSANATALIDTRLMRLPKNSVLDYMMQNRDFAFTIANRLSKRLQTADNQISELISLSRELRVLKELVNYWQQEGKHSTRDGFLLVDFKNFIVYAKQNLGLEEKETNRSLAKLQKQKTISAKRNSKKEVVILFESKVFEYFNSTSVVFEK